jgi:glycosyltransferase involved in cell wall biosynthesis
MTLLVLYEDLAGYFVKCISVFSKLYTADVHIIRKAVNKEAPFELELGMIKTYTISEYTDEELMQLAHKIKPDAILCGGWSSKAYLKIVKAYKGKIPTVIGFDNKWSGSLKQQLASIAAPFFITNKFDKCFVPAVEQRKFALKMGFKDAQIAEGAYCCDFDFFHGQYLANKEQKAQQFPKKFIYVGRYVPHKGIHDLWRAFMELQEEQPNAWELWCMGTGDVKPVQHPKIKHFGFVQPAAMINFIRDTGVFILPSHVEPWGVVIHEFAAAGFPIICSDEVGARTTFVENNLNGYIYASGNVEELKSAMAGIINSSEEKLNGMSQASVSKAKQITPEIWAKQLISLL